MCLGVFFCKIVFVLWPRNLIRDRASNIYPVLLPPYRIIGQLHILRQTLTINFDQENMRYVT
jgi:hypothetical protein